jgi:predicted TIM-barrel fold metal-dependent hydrolase
MATDQAFLAAGVMPMSAPDNTASIASTGHGCVDPLGGPDLLIDPHAHFHTPLSNRTDWMRYNASRLDFGERIGIRCHVASILGAWGHTSPTDFTSPHDQTLANDCMFDLAEREAPRVKAFVAVNPNFTAHALTEITRGMARGAVGITLAAGRRTTDFALLDDIASAAAQYGVPVLQHIWQHRRREWPNQEAFDGVELAQLAVRHPRVTFLLAPIGGGDWGHTIPAVRDVPNIAMALSGSGIDRGMIDEALRWVGASRLLWACDLTLCAGLTKLRALAYTGASPEEIAAMRWRNAVRIFPAGTFDAALARPLALPLAQAVAPTTEAA